MFRVCIAVVCLFGFCCFVASSPATAAPQLPAIELAGQTMGPVPYKIVVAHYPADVTEKELHAQVTATLERVNGLMSTYIPDSDVSRFNRSESTDFQPVDLETATVVARAIEISKQTDGAFDITVGPAVNLWNFGPNKKKFELPTDAQIDAISDLVGFEKLDVQTAPPAIRKTIPGVKIDLSAIAKGYAVDQVAQTLRDVGCEKFLVEIGGEVFAQGTKTNGSKWRVGIERPDRNDGRFDHIATISDQALATSGDYRNFHVHDGKIYSHTIDPKTCRPVEHAMASASTIADDCMTADALATAMMVMGPKKSKAVCNKLGVAFVTLERIEDSDKYRETIADDFPILKQSPPPASTSTSIWPALIGAIVVFTLVILGMAVGSIFGNKPITGSCGGLANMPGGGGSECGVCSKPATDCVEQSASSNA